MFYTQWALQAGAVAALPAEYPERAAYVATGEVEVDGRAFGPGRMLVLTPGATATFRALQLSTLMLLGGEPVGPRFVEWNTSSKAPIEQAKADWREGRMRLPAADRAEWIPLPPDPSPAPKPHVVRLNSARSGPERHSGTTTPTAAAAKASPRMRRPLSH